MRKIAIAIAALAAVGIAMPLTTSARANESKVVIKEGERHHHRHHAKIVIKEGDRHHHRDLHRHHRVVGSSSTIAVTTTTTEQKWPRQRGHFFIGGPRACWWPPPMPINSSALRVLRWRIGWGEKTGGNRSGDRSPDGAKRNPGSAAKSRTSTRDLEKALRLDGLKNSLRAKPATG